MIKSTGTKIAREVVVVTAQAPRQCRTRIPHQQHCPGASDGIGATGPIMS